MERSDSGQDPHGVRVTTMLTAGLRQPILAAKRR